MMYMILFKLKYELVGPHALHALHVCVYLCVYVCVRAYGCVCPRVYNVYYTCIYACALSRYM